MPMTPTTGGDVDLVGLSFAEIPTATHKLDITRGRVIGMTDGQDAMVQAVYLILNTDRYAFPIYSWRYGIERVDLIGKPREYVMSELKRRVNEALLQDDRITGTEQWSFESGKRSLQASFVVNTIYGQISTETEVAV